MDDATGAAAKAGVEVGGSPGMRRNGLELAVVVVTLVLWIPGLRVLAGVYGEVEWASHGFLVPIVALWAATAHRAALADRPARPLRGGVALLGALVLAYLAKGGYASVVEDLVSHSHRVVADVAGSIPARLPTVERHLREFYDASATPTGPREFGKKVFRALHPETAG